MYQINKNYQICKVYWQMIKHNSREIIVNVLSVLLKNEEQLEKYFKQEEYKFKEK
jgi:hypothetical protein